jgi:catechol 2,3-dioxygenase-like lactoylglutathione lyase family enzyme
MLIGDLFHVVHVVDDLSLTEAWYDATFAPTYMFRHHESALDQRTASLMLFADFPPEPMTPFPNAAGLAGNIGRFRARFGERFHSIAFYSDEVEAAYERFRSSGIRVIGDGGADLDGPPQRGAIYTNPRDTFGLIELMEPRRAGKGGAPVGDTLGECYDPRLLGTHRADQWEKEHPLGIRRTSQLTVLVDDLEAATRLYVDVLEGAPFYERHEEADQIFVFVGTETVVELRKPAAGTEEADHLLREGGMIWSVTLLVTDLDRAAHHLEDTGNSPQRSEHFISLPVGSSHGARYVFTDLPVPGDPRVEDRTGATI